MQLGQFLQQYFICDASIRDIGPTRTATLASFGIETAFDVEEEAVLNVPGFGEKYTQHLVRWRQEIARKFVYDPKVGIPVQEQRNLEIKFGQARQSIELRLLGGAGELQSIGQQAERELGLLYNAIRSHLQTLVQRELDLKVLPPGM